MHVRPLSQINVRQRRDSNPHLRGMNPVFIHYTTLLLLWLIQHFFFIYLIENKIFLFLLHYLLFFFKLFFISTARSRTVTLLRLNTKWQPPLRQEAIKINVYLIYPTFHPTFKQPSPSPWRAESTKTNTHFTVAFSSTITDDSCFLSCFRVSENIRNFFMSL